VWYGRGIFDIYAHDLSTGKTIRLTDTPEHERFLNIYENMVVYPRSFSDTNYYIYVYDLDAGEEIRITDTPEFIEKSPDIYGNRIVFGRTESQATTEIIVYNLDTNEEMKIDSPSDFNYGLEIYGDKVVWSAFDVSEEKSRG